MSTGYLYAFGAFALIGSYMVPVRFTTAKGLPFMSCMGVGMAVVMAFRLSSLQALWVHPKWFWASILSGLFWACGQGLANLTLEEVSLAKASVLFNINSLINMAVGLMFFHEASGLKAYLFLLAGGILLSAGAWWVAHLSPAPHKERNLKKGVLFGLLAGLFWGVYFAPIKAVQLWDPQTSLSSTDALTGLMLGGLVSAIPLAFAASRGSWTPRNLGLGFVTAVLWTLGSTYFLLAIDRLGLSRAVPIVNASGLVYAGWSIFVFKEFPFSLWPKVLSGALVVAAGAVLMAFSK